ncbi:MAG TPA: pesticin C-terminus-like muramidase [Burkholderiaceae bacterium]
MADTRVPGVQGQPASPIAVPARTPGPLGRNDAADPNTTARLGDTPGTSGVNDSHAPSLPAATAAGGPPAAKLPDGTAIAPGADGKAAALVCPAPLAKRADGGKVDVDWAFIREREGDKLDGYVPDASGSSSGVTIATGIDLGQRSGSDIDKLDITDDLKKKLKPYCLKTGKDATDLLAKSPLSITADEASALTKAVKGPMLDALIKEYDAAVDKANAADHCARVHFAELPGSVQTALASAQFQYNSLSSRTQNYWKQVTQQKWDEASKNLKNFGDRYKTRRKLEAGLIDDAIAAAVPPK